MTATTPPEHTTGSAAPGSSGLSSAPVGSSSALPKRFGRNVIMNYAAQGTAALSAIVLTPLLLHHLGKVAFGVWVLASAVVIYLELFELGFGGATAKLVAEDAVHRPDQALRTINTTFFALIPLGVLALAVGTGVAFAFPVVMHVAPQLHDQVILVVFILAIGLAVSIPGDTFGGALMGHQRYDLLGLSNSLLVACTFVTSIVVVLLGGGLLPLALTMTGFGVLFHFVRFAMLRRVAPGMRVSLHLIDRSRLRSVMHLSGWFLLTAVLQAIYNFCDTAVVGVVLGLRAAAVYAVAYKLAGAATQGLDSLASVFFPYASSVSRNQNRGALAEITVDGTRAAMFVGMLISLLFLVLAFPGIRIWVGAGYGTSSRVLMVLAAAIVLASPVRVTTMVLAGSNRLPLVSVLRGAEVAVHLGVSVALAYVLGPVGVALGTLAGVLLVRLPGNLVFGDRAVGIGTGAMVRRTIVPHLAPTAACGAALFLLHGLAGRSVGWLILAGVVGVAVYTFVYFSLGATPGERERAGAAVARFVPPRWRPTSAEQPTDVQEPVVAVPRAVEAERS